MKVEIEIRSFMSRAELDRALQVAIEAAGRLAPRMNGGDLQRLENYASALLAVAENERRREGLPRRLIKSPLTVEARATDTNRDFASRKDTTLCIETFDRESA